MKENVNFLMSFGDFFIGLIVIYIFSCFDVFLYIYSPPFYSFHLGYSNIKNSINEMITKWNEFKNDPNENVPVLGVISTMDINAFDSSFVVELN